MIKLPNQTQDIEIKLTSNILDVYNQTLLGHPAILKKGDFKFKEENIKDTLMDMAIYSLITMILYEEASEPEYKDDMDPIIDED